MAKGETNESKRAAARMALLSYAADRGAGDVCSAFISVMTPADFSDSSEDGELRNIFIAACSSGDRAMVNAMHPLLNARFGPMFPWDCPSFQDISSTGKTHGGFGTRNVFDILTGKGFQGEKAASLNVLSMLVFHRNNTPFPHPPEVLLKAYLPKLFRNYLDSRRKADILACLVKASEIGLKPSELFGDNYHFLKNLLKPLSPEHGQRKVEENREILESMMECLFERYRVEEVQSVFDKKIGLSSTESDILSKMKPMLEHYILSNTGAEGSKKAKNRL